MMITILSIVVCAFSSLIFMHYVGRKRLNGSQRYAFTLKNRIIIGVVGMLLGFLLGKYVVTPLIQQPPTGPRIVIDTPIDGSTVDHVTLVKGFVEGMPQDRYLWILILPEGTISYHPQSGPLPIEQDMRWSGTAYIGIPDMKDSGRAFAVILAITDNQGTKNMQEYLSDAQLKRSYSGIKPLPSDIIPIAQIHVVRK